MQNHGNWIFSLSQLGRWLAALPQQILAEPRARPQHIIDSIAHHEAAAKVGASQPGDGDRAQEGAHAGKRHEDPQPAPPYVQNIARKQRNKHDEGNPEDAGQGHQREQG